MDAVAAASAVLGLVAFALHSTRILLQQVDQIQEAPTAVKDIRIDLEVLVETLESLSHTLNTETLDNLPATNRSLLFSIPLQKALRSCKSICDEFSKQLTSWTKHSTSDKLSKRDQLKIGFFGDSKIKTFITRTSTCKSTITLALVYMNFTLSMNQMSSAQARSESLQQQTTSLLNQEVVVERQAEATDASLQQLIARSSQNATSDLSLGGQPLLIDSRQYSTNDSSSIGQQSTEAIDDLRNELALLKNQRDMIATIMLEMKKERDGAELSIKTGDQSTATGGRATVGVFGSSEELNNSKSTITTGNIRAESDSRLFVGRSNNFDMNKFFD